MYGRQYDIRFDSTSATMLSLTTHEQLLLKRLRSKIPTYSANYNKQGIAFTTLLRCDTVLIMRVTMTLPPPLDSKPDTVYRAGFMEITNGNSAWASVDCYLKKADGN
jgi:hypothetical protein